MTKFLYKMECITNMHVGSGEENYNIIDNEVQKDVVLSYVPIIHASGVKGAIREFSRNNLFKDKTDADRTNILNSIFGTADEGGSYKFFDAKMVARPLRVSSGDKPYLMATSLDILYDFSLYLEGLGFGGIYGYESPSNLESIKKGEFITLLSKIENFKLENKMVSSVKESDCDMLKKIEKLICKDIVLTKTLQGYDLPVIARNALDDNGQSKNLWYEEVVPHKSIFFFAIHSLKTTTNIDFELDNKVIQFGANASIGRGYAKITRIHKEVSDE